MASFSKSSTTVLIVFLFTVFCTLHNFSVSSFEFEVGGTHGWVVPPANDSKIYNDWASENRFQVGDTVRFRYRKDSVMEVNETEYKRCNSSHPNFFSNNGNSVFRLNQPGPFYFISGVSGHCEKGQRMIVKVMSHEEESPSGGAGGKSSSGSHVAVSSLGVSALVFLQFVLSFVASNVI